MTLTITTHRLPGDAIAINPDGAITSDNASELRDRVTAVLAATKPDTIVVDMGAVPAIDEAGVGALMSGQGAAAACDASLVVVDAHPTVHEQLSARGLGEMLTERATAGRRSAARGV